MLNRTLNDNPSVHVYETISVYGKNNELQQAKLIDAEFYKNLLLTSNYADEFSKDAQRLSTNKFVNNNSKSLKYCNKNDKAFLATFYNNFGEDNQIIRNSNNNNKYFNDFNFLKQQHQEFQQKETFQNLFLNMNSQNNAKSNNLFLPEAVV